MKTQQKKFSKHMGQQLVSGQEFFWVSLHIVSLIIDLGANI